MLAYCENELEISGPATAVAAFVAACEGEDELLDWQRLIAEPDIGNLGGKNGWHNWRMAHWGTKWSPSDVERTQVSKTRASYRYQTHAAPAVYPIVAMSFRYPEVRVTLSYASEANDFSGRLDLLAGNVLDEQAGTYRDICCDDEDGTGGGNLLGPLSEVCRRLERSLKRDVADEILQLVRGNDAPEDIEELLVALPDRVLVEAYLAGEPDRAWELAETAISHHLGGGVLVTMRSSANPETARIGRVCSHFYAGLSGGRSATLRAHLQEARLLGDLDGYIDTLESLAKGWNGDDIDEFLRAALLLHFR